jgi:hypothetical protein
MASGGFAREMLEKTGDEDAGEIFERYLLKGERLTQCLYSIENEADSEFVEVSDLEKNGWVDYHENEDKLPPASYIEFLPKTCFNISLQDTGASLSVQPPTRSLLLR